MRASTLTSTFCSRPGAVPDIVELPPPPPEPSDFPGESPVLRCLPQWRSPLWVVVVWACRGLRFWRCKREMMTVGARLYPTRKVSISRAGRRIHKHSHFQGAGVGRRPGLKASPKPPPSLHPYRHHPCILIATSPYPHVPALYTKNAQGKSP